MAYSACQLPVDFDAICERDTAKETKNIESDCIQHANHDLKNFICLLGLSSMFGIEGNF